MSLEDEVGCWEFVVVVPVASPDESRQAKGSPLKLKAAARSCFMVSLFSVVTMSEMEGPEELTTTLKLSETPERPEHPTAAALKCLFAEEGAVVF